MTAQERLNEIDAAITGILEKGQSYTIDTGSGTRTFNRATLQTLWLMRREVAAEVQREAAGGIRVTYGVPL